MTNFTQTSALALAAILIGSPVAAKELPVTDMPGLAAVAAISMAVPAGAGTEQPAGKSGRSKAAEKKARKFNALVRRYAVTYSVPLSLAHAVIEVESNYRANARGAAGEVGLMQIKPATARMMGYKGSAAGLFDPETNIKYGMKYLGKARELGGKTTCGTVLKYNAGHAAKRMNPVSAAYCAKVKRRMKGS